MNWSIANKIRFLLWSSLGGALFVMLLLLVVQSVGERRSNRLERELRTRVDVMARFTATLDGHQGVVRRILREKDPDTLFALIAKDSALRERLKTISDSIGSQRLDSSYHRLAGLDAELLQLILQGRTAEAQDLYLEQSGMLVDAIVEVKQELTDSWNEEARIRRSSWQRQRSLFVVVLLLVVVASAAGAGFAGLRLVEGIVQPLEVAQRTMADIAAGEGDLTRRLEVRTNDEIGQLAEAFNRFVERVQNTVRTVESSVGILGKASDRIVMATDALAKGADGVAHRSREVSGSSLEVGRRVGSASLSTGSLSQGLSMVASAIEELSASVREVSRSCQEEAQLATKANHDVSAARDNFRRLVEATKVMTGLLDGIQDISDQTQLLALNATIEAARAGEAGRGFAVVAASVKDLAKQASSTTKEIGTRIEEMTRAMEGAESSLDSLEATVGSVKSESNSVAAAVEEQEATIAELSRSIGETHRQSQSIASDVHGASTATESSAHEIKGVSDGIGKVVSDIATIREGLEEIEGRSVELRELVGRFKT